MCQLAEKPRLAEVLGVLLAAVLAGCSGEGTAPAESLVSCLESLTGVERLCRAPAGQVVMFSSYDRSGGNQDNKNFMGTLPDGSSVLAEVRGAGCVRRIWLTSWPADEEMRFYLDGESTPRLVLTREELRTGATFPFVPPLCDYPSGGIVSYVPIPFARSLRITTPAQLQGKFFYHINVEKFPRGMRVQSYPGVLSAQDRTDVQAALDTWTAVSEFADLDTDRGFTAPKELGLASKAVLYEGRGPAMVNHLAVRLTFPDGLPIAARNQVLRALAIRCFWDDQQDPSVEAPFGDFFCNGLRPRSFASLPIVVRDGVYVCRFPMPFRTGARIELENRGPVPVRIESSVDASKIDAWTDDLRYFHAAWRHAVGDGRPYEILFTEGRGYYAGCYLVAMAAEASWNILESDETMFVDGEAAPSLHGTGLEDYFNGGWYYADGIFDTPLAGNLDRSAIRTSQYRFHVPDPVAFDKRLRVNIEFGHGNASRGYMSGVAYWYLDQPTAAAYRLPELQRTLMPLDPLERQTAMCEIIERDRIGHVDEAMDLCREYADKYPNTAEAEMLMLRAVAYQELLSGYEAVSNEYAAVSTDAKQEATRKQAALLMRYHESDRNALLCAHINGRYRVYLDGQPVLGGEEALEANATIVTLEPGEHVLAAEVVWVRPDPWFNVVLRAHGGELYPNLSWRVSAAAPEGWKSAGFDDSEWVASDRRGTIPKMGYFQFKPNAFVNTQYALLGGPPRPWKPLQGRTTYFRLTVHVDENGVPLLEGTP